MENLIEDNEESQVDAVANAKYFFWCYTRVSIVFAIFNSVYLVWDFQILIGTLMV